MNSSLRMCSTAGHRPPLSIIGLRPEYLLCPRISHTPFYSSKFNFTRELSKSLIFNLKLVKAASKHKYNFSCTLLTPFQNTGVIYVCVCCFCHPYPLRKVPVNNDHYLPIQGHARLRCYFVYLSFLYLLLGLARTLVRVSRRVISATNRTETRAS